MTVYGLEGLDEISISGETLIGELREDEVHEYTVHPQQFGFALSPIEALRVAQDAKTYVIKSSGANNEESFGVRSGIVAVKTGDIEVQQ